MIDPGKLQLPYPRWKKYIDSIEDELDEENLRWLRDWNLWDLACSPMDDNERRLIRYEHFLDWFAR